MEEIWKDIAGYEGKYQVSNLGNVRSVDRFVLSTSGRNRFFAGRDIPKRKDDFGYTIVSLSDRTTKGKEFIVLLPRHFCQIQTIYHALIIRIGILQTTLCLLTKTVLLTMKSRTLNGVR